MTFTLSSLAGTDDVRARREAALDRLHAGSGGTARTVRRAKPSRRAVQRPAPRLSERLGPAPGVFYLLMVIVAVFVMLGLVMVLSATSAKSVGGDASPYSVFNRQLMWAGMGLVGMLVVLKVPYHRWRAFVIPGSVLAAGAMMLPFVPSVGATINDANSWVRFGSFGLPAVGVPQARGDRVPGRPTSRRQSGRGPRPPARHLCRWRSSPFGCARASASSRAISVPRSSSAR